MYVCVCKGVTDTQITDAVANGVDSLRGLRLQLGVGSQCGRCTNCACDLLNQAGVNAAPTMETGSFGGCAVVAYAAPAQDL